MTNACKEIMARLAPFKEQNPEGKWEDWVNAAYFKRINLVLWGLILVVLLNVDPCAHGGILKRFYNLFQSVFFEAIFQMFVCIV